MAKVYNNKTIGDRPTLLLIAEINDVTNKS